MEATRDEPEGLFFRDTRHLSRWRLTVDGAPPDLLSVDDVDYFAAQFFLYPPTGTIYENPYLSVIRRRYVGDGFHEDVTIHNHRGEPVEVELRMEAGADFADLFEVRDALEKTGELYRDVREGALVLGYRRADFVRETRISASAAAEIDQGGLTFRVTIEPKSEWNTCVDVAPVADEVQGADSAAPTIRRAGSARTPSERTGRHDRVPTTPTRPKYRHGERSSRPNMPMSLDEWLADAPKLESDWDPLPHIRRRSLVDLAALRFYPPILGGESSLPAAGRPGS